MEAIPFSTFPPQHQDRQPGSETLMDPHPIYDNPGYIPAGKLKNKTAIITGGDSGIGRAVTIAFAKEGANVVIVHLQEDNDARQTAEMVRSYGAECSVIAADLRQEENAQKVIENVILQYGTLDILVNNAAVQFPQKSLLDITTEQWTDTFETNIFSMFYLTKAALPYLKTGNCIINTASVTAFNGHEELLDYSATKGAIVAFTRSLSLSLQSQGIRVNAVAPGPVWTPLIVSSFTAEQVETFGSTSPMKRAAQPYELAPAYVYLASEDSSNVSGQIMHVNSGTIIG